MTHQSPATPMFDGFTARLRRFGLGVCDTHPDVEAVRIYYPNCKRYKWQCCGRQFKDHPKATQPLVVPDRGATVPTSRSGSSKKKTSGETKAHLKLEATQPETNLHQAYVARLRRFGLGVCDTHPDVEAVRIYYPNCKRYKWQCCGRQFKDHPIATPQLGERRRA